MKFADLGPVRTPTPNGDHIAFDCPKCGGAHVIGVRVGPNGWTESGEFPATTSFEPSIRVLGQCEWQGFVTNGEIRTV